MSDRRKNVPFNPSLFEESAREGIVYSREETFRQIYVTNHWKGESSVSGLGAGRAQTRELERALPRIVADRDVDVLLDLPCGDYSWMQFVELPVSLYLGADIVPEIVAANAERHGDARHRFMVLDLVNDPLPQADLLLCRDCLVHLSFEDIGRALENIRRSGIAWLLATTFPACEANEDIVTGDWRPLDMRKPPFDFPEPLELINEGCSEGGGQFRDKSLGLWPIGVEPR